MQQNERKNSDNLTMGVRVALSAGDLLVFGTNMMHRGIYGMDRLSLEILFCDPVPELVKFVDESCLPNSGILKKLENATAFETTMNIKASGKVLPV